MLIFVYPVMVPGMAGYYIAFVRKLFNLFFGHIVRPAKRHRHKKKHALKTLFLHFRTGYFKLVEIGIIKSKHDGFAWQRSSLGQVIIQLIR